MRYILFLSVGTSLEVHSTPHFGVPLELLAVNCTWAATEVFCTAAMEENENHYLGPTSWIWYGDTYWRDYLDCIRGSGLLSAVDRITCFDFRVCNWFLFLRKTPPNDIWPIDTQSKPLPCPFFSNAYNSMIDARVRSKLDCLIHIHLINQRLCACFSWHKLKNKQIN